jgi:hypothetical protein
LLPAAFMEALELIWMLWVAYNNTM